MKLQQKTIEDSIVESYETLVATMINKMRDKWSNKTNYAYQLGISRSQLYKIFDGRAYPDLETVKKMVKIIYHKYE